MNLPTIIVLMAQNPIATSWYWYLMSKEIIESICIQCTSSEILTLGHDNGHKVYQISQHSKYKSTCVWRLILVTVVINPIPIHWYHYKCAETNDRAHQSVCIFHWLLESRGVIDVWANNVWESQSSLSTNEACCSTTHIDVSSTLSVLKRNYVLMCEILNNVWKKNIKRAAAYTHM